MRREAGRSHLGRALVTRETLGLALLVIALPAAGCRRGGAVVAPDPVHVPPGIAEPAPPAPVDSTPEDAALRSALDAMDAGRLPEAAAGLESVLAMGGGSHGRALYALALVLARPDNEARDAARASSLLGEYLATQPDPSGAASAGLILGLLGLESRYADQIRELRERAAASGAESEDLRLALAQREAELRRIKDILLGRSGGL